MLDVDVVDAHVHFWNPRTTPREASLGVKLVGWSPGLMKRLVPLLVARSKLDFVGKTDYVLGNYLPSDWKADIAGVPASGFVHVQAGWHAKGTLAPAGETAWVESIGGPTLLGIVGQADLDAPHLPELLDAHRAASKRFVGVRHMTSWSADKRFVSWTMSGSIMQTPAWQKGLALVGERGLTFDAWCYSHQLRDLCTALDSAKNTRVVLCHLGTPIGAGNASDRERLISEWRDDLAAVASRPNAYTKISGLLMPILGFELHTRATPPTVSEIVDRIGPLVEHALGVFGVDRCIVASNFPMDKVSAPLATIYAAFAELTRSRGREAQAKLFGGNARAFYGLQRLVGLRT
jgi:predicted TIM-barrel fold metal-dependent hydrolase